MRIFGLGFALIIGAAPLLQGCGDARGVQTGMQPALAASTRQSATTAAHFLHSGSWMAGKTSSSDLIYMVLGNTVGIYNFSGDQVGALKGFEGVAGLCSDTQGNVWVTYGNSLLEYTHAGTVPIAQVYLPSGYGAESCAVDPSSGNLAVTERSGKAPVTSPFIRISIMRRRPIPIRISNTMRTALMTARVTSSSTERAARRSFLRSSLTIAPHSAPSTSIKSWNSSGGSNGTVSILRSATVSRTWCIN